MSHEGVSNTINISSATNEGADPRGRLRHAATTAHTVVSKAIGGVLQQVDRHASDRGARGGTTRPERRCLSFLTPNCQKQKVTDDLLSLCRSVVVLSKMQVGVTEVILAVNYQPQVMLAALESMEKKVQRDVWQDVSCVALVFDTCTSLVLDGVVNN